MRPKKKNPNAVALGSRGGKARAKSLSAEELSAIGKKAARWRVKNLTATERKEIARKAAVARWAKTKTREKK